MEYRRIEDYVRYAADHGKFTLDGDAEATNTAYDRLQHIFKEIVSNGEGNQLFRLYEHNDPWVQAWAASHTLELNESRAIAKLEQLKAADIPHISSGARYTLEGWKNDGLRFLAT